MTAFPFCLRRVPILSLSVCCLSIGIFSACSPSRAVRKTTTDSVYRDTAMVSAAAAAPKCCAKKSESETAKADSVGEDFEIPDVELVDHEGKRVRFFTDLVKGRTVAINTFFTSCTTICPLLTTTIAQLQKTLAQRGREDIQLISISVDPTTDTPNRLKVWSRNFNVKPGWTMLTGRKATVDKLLKALHAFTPDPTDHSPMILVGNEPEGVWKQIYGLAPAAQLCDAIIAVAGPKKPAKDHQTAVLVSDPEAPATLDGNAEAREYFTDVELIDQNGNSLRLYSDLLRDHVVVIDSFFSSCTGVCPVLNQKLTAIKEAFSEQMGKELIILSITVDPEVDTPARLKEYAKGLRAGPGWYFLTGSRENLETALSKFGMYVEFRENHSNLLMIGNDATGLWKKAFGLAPSEQVVEIVESVLYDRETPDPTVVRAESKGQNVGSN